MKIKLKRSPFQSSPGGCVSNHPVLVIYSYVVFIASFAFSFDDYSVSSGYQFSVENVNLITE